MAQVRSVTSEALEAQIRDLLPSQNGFTEDLQASNVITPIIDLTAAAEGTTTPSYLTRAWDFSTDYDNISNATTTIINTPGFWQVDVNFNSDTGGAARTGSIYITDSLTNKVIWEINTANSSQNNPVVVAEAAFVVFLRAGDSLVASSNNTNAKIDMWHRQIADVNGNITNPLGFTPQ